MDVNPHLIESEVFYAQIDLVPIPIPLPSVLNGCVPRTSPRSPCVLELELEGYFLKHPNVTTMVQYSLSSVSWVKIQPG